MEFEYIKDDLEEKVIIRLELNNEEINEAYKSMDEFLRDCVSDLLDESGMVSDFIMGLQIICREIENNLS